MSKKKEDDIVLTTPEDFINHVNASYRQEFGTIGKVYPIPRFSSSALSLDLALGGGWPFTLISLILGDESTGKTSIALKACESVTHYDHTTKKHKSQVDNFTPGRALWVSYDPFDFEWAESLGFDVKHHAVITPETTQHGIDIITLAIQQNLFDLIVLDCISVMSHAVELKESVEDQTMGVNARLLNMAFRKWLTRLNSSRQSSISGPHLMCLNHYHTKMVLMGDPREPPGGKGQKHASSIIVSTKKTKYTSIEKEASIATFSGVIKKNKTFVPEKVYSFDMALRDTDTYLCGQVISTKTLMDYGRKNGLIVVEPGRCEFDGSNYKTQKELAEEITLNETVRDSLWQEILKRELG